MKIVKLTNIPWALSKIPEGSMDSNKLCTQLLAQIASFEVTVDKEFMKKTKAA